MGQMPPPPPPKPPPDIECRSPWPASIALAAMVVLIFSYGIWKPFEDALSAPSGIIHFVDTAFDTIGGSGPGDRQQVIMTVRTLRSGIDSLMTYRVSTSNVKSPAFDAQPVSLQVWWLDWTSGLPDSSRLEPPPDTIDVIVIPHSQPNPDTLPPLPELFTQPSLRKYY